jgi:hypothetical protein
MQVKETNPMPPLAYVAMSTAEARRLQSGGVDAYGLPQEQKISDGDGAPCRHCLTDVAEGDPYLVLSYRPFPALQPYAETGPIFLHAEPCARAEIQTSVPPMLAKRPAHLVRGYGPDDRIVNGTGAVIASVNLDAEATRILARPGVAYVHVRSAVNSCYTCRIEWITDPSAA